MSIVLVAYAWFMFAIIAVIVVCLTIAVIIDYADQWSYDKRMKKIEREKDEPRTT